MMVHLGYSEQTCASALPSSSIKRSPEMTEHLLSETVEHAASTLHSSKESEPLAGEVSSTESLAPGTSPWPGIATMEETWISSSSIKPVGTNIRLEKKCSELLEACCNHDLGNATRILNQSTPDQGPEQIKQLVLARNDFRDSALHLACTHGDPDIVRLLLARGAEVDAENNLGSTPLNLAAVAGSEEVVEILLDAGADVDHMDDISGTPLHGAARRNLSKCCRVLLNRGACVDAPDGVGNRPLHLAAAEGAMSALETLVRHYADTRLRNMRGQTALDVARASWIGSQCKDKIARVLASNT